jgi:hypothetical protein
MLEPAGRPRRARAVVVGVFMLGSGAWLLYQHGTPALAERVLFVYAGCLLLGPSLVYGILRGAGSSPGRSTAIALAVPVLWLAKELWRVSAAHPWLEALYYALNPISLGVFCAAGVPMALLEIALRRWREGAWRLGGWPGATLAGFLLLAGAAAAVGRDSGGRDIFYAYVALYRVLFAAD